MSKYNRHIVMLILIAILFLPSVSQAQGIFKSKFYYKIKDYDLSELWRADSIITEGNGEYMSFPEPLGFIGNDYQRFYIHITSVTKSSNPYEYIVKGKTKVKNTICPFQGTINVLNARLYTDTFETEATDMPYIEGIVESECLFYEDSSQTSSGFIYGSMTTEIYIDTLNKIHYNALYAVGDGFYNNQFTGIWSSYSKRLIKKCHWGDCRIPDAGDLDIGTGEFYVNDKYEENGWKEYQTALVHGEYTQEQILLARDEENKEWWK